MPQRLNLILSLSKDAGHSCRYADVIPQPGQPAAFGFRISWASSMTFSPMTSA